MGTGTPPRPTAAIAWHEYGPEAFSLAKQTGRPLLVDVGAVWCHWCHVMDRTTYGDPEVVRLVNERFVAVRVDRDRLPGVDRRLQQSVAAYQVSATGRASGGWPLTAFLTPGGALIHGETYMPPERFLRVAAAVADAVGTHGDEIDAREAAVAQALATRRDRAPDEAGGAVPTAVTEAIVSLLRQEFDPRHGGFGAAPKFPAPTAIALLLRAGSFGPRWANRPPTLENSDWGEAHQATWGLKSDDPERLGMALKTLTAMAAGGIHDHVGGGFHRYSVDARWVVPHFEKMLDVNAAMLDNYLDLLRAAESPAARRAAEGILRFTGEVLSDRERGGFYASQDADVGLSDDGRYFTWSLADFKAAVPEEALALATSHFGVAEVGQMEETDGFTRRPTDQNVLCATKTIEQLAAMHGVTPSAARSAIERALEGLRRARAKRPAPAVDRTILVDWNAAMCRAYLKAAVVLGRPDARAFALTTLDRLAREAHDPARGMAHVLAPEGGATGHGHLADNAGFAAALLDAYEHTGERRHLDLARALMDLVAATLWDPRGGGFLDVLPAEDAVGLFRRPQKDIQDHTLPSGNAVAAETLIRLWQLTGQGGYRERAERLLATLGDLAGQLGSFGAGLALAIDLLTGDPAHLIIVGPVEAAATRALHAAALAVDHPRRTVQALDPGRDADLLEALGRAPLDRPALFVCGRDFCLEPVFDPADLPARVEALNNRDAGPLSPSG